MGDQTMIHKTTLGGCVVLMVYVDYILLTGRDEVSIFALKVYLH